jgi:hypothetical protein
MREHPGCFLLTCNHLETIVFKIGDSIFKGKLELLK